MPLRQKPSRVTKNCKRLMINSIGAVPPLLCLIFFAFTTILGWSYYSERCLTYLRGKASHTLTLAFRWLYIVAVFIGPYLTVEAVWDTADVFNGLMAFPNVIALIALSGVVAMDTKQYFAEKRHQLR